MKSLIDAQLPARLARRLNDAGHDAIHTIDLPESNRTSDTEIIRIADSQARIVVSKDRDFRDSHLLVGTPARLLVVSTGNITNGYLLALFDEQPRSNPRGLRALETRPAQRRRAVRP